jgi:hypothetical protein
MDLLHVAARASAMRKLRQCQKNPKAPTSTPVLNFRMSGRPFYPRIVISIASGATPNVMAKPCLASAIVSAPPASGT